MLKAFLTVFIIFNIVIGANAQSSDGLAGFEWTFTNLELVNASRPQPYIPDLPPLAGQGPYDRALNTTQQQIQMSPWARAQHQWIDEIKKACPSCLIKNNTITTPDGFWFKITLDGPVLEVLTEPMTYQQLKNRQEALETLIWGTAKKAGLTPDKRLGGGHLHLDIESHFKGDRMLFRNFVVDLMNRPELFMGGFGLNYFNSPFSFYGVKAIQEFKKLVSTFDNDPTITIETFMEQMNELYRSFEHPVLPTPYAKFQAVNFKHLILSTLEIRALRPQVSAKHAKKVVKIFQSRLKALSKRNKPLKVKIPDHSKIFSSTKKGSYRIFSHDLPPQTIMTAVEDYAESSKLQRDFYTDYITEELKADLAAEAKTKKANNSIFAGSCSSFL